MTTALTSSTLLWESAIQIDRMRDAVRMLALDRASGRRSPRRRVSVSATQRKAIASLFNAVLAREPKRVAKALERGVKVDSRSIDGETALLIAAMTPGNDAVVDLLLRSNAAVDARDDRETTPLIVAVSDDNIVTVALLLERGADVNSMNAAGDTPLTNAACWGSEKTVKALLVHGANPLLPNGVGTFASELAAMHGHKKLAAELKLAERNPQKPVAMNPTPHPGRAGRRGGSSRRR